MASGFVIAPGSERVLTAGSYLVGIVELAVVVGALAFGAVSVRRLLLPAWAGAPARLAEIVIGMATLVIVSELVGVVGLFTEAVEIVALLLAGVGGGIGA